jgi:methionine-rich copper-binding protein CopC
MRSASLLGFVFALGMVAAALSTRSSSAPTATTSTHVVQTTSTATLTARLGKVTSGRHRIAVAISVTRPARATADLLNVHGRRLAHATARVRHRLTLVLRPAQPLPHGSYLLRIRVTAGGSTVTATRTVRVA